MSKLPRSTNTCQNANNIFHRNRKKTLKFIWKCKRLEEPKQSWTKRKKYYKVIVLKTVWYWHKNRHGDQWKRIKSSEKHPHIYRQLTFSKNTQWWKQGILNKWETWIFTYRRTKLDPYLIPCTKTNSKSTRLK
jgi:hypothetical protein